LKAVWTTVPVSQVFIRIISSPENFNLKSIERWPNNKVVNISDLTSNSHQSQSMGKTKPNLKEMSQKTKNKTKKQFEQQWRSWTCSTAATSMVLTIYHNNPTDFISPQQWTQKDFYLYYHQEHHLQECSSSSGKGNYSMLPQVNGCPVKNKIGE
jgi:hypothetical protein